MATDPLKWHVGLVGYGEVGRILAEDLRGHAPVRLLLSGLISHAEADRPLHIGDVMQLAGFWGDLLAR